MKALSSDETPTVGFWTIITDGVITEYDPTKEADMEAYEAAVAAITADSADDDDDEDDS